MNKTDNIIDMSKCRVGTIVVLKNGYTGVYIGIQENMDKAQEDLYTITTMDEKNIIACVDKKGKCAKDEQCNVVKFISHEKHAYNSVLDGLWDMSTCLKKTLFPEWYKIQDEGTETEVDENRQEALDVILHKLAINAENEVTRFMQKQRKLWKNK